MIRSQWLKCLELLQKDESTVWQRFNLLTPLAPSAAKTCRLVPHPCVGSSIHLGMQSSIKPPTLHAKNARAPTTLPFWAVRDSMPYKALVASFFLMMVRTRFVIGLWCTHRPLKGGSRLPPIALTVQRACCIFLTATPSIRHSGHRANLQVGRQCSGISKQRLHLPNRLSTILLVKKAFLMMSLLRLKKIRTGRRSTLKKISWHASVNACRLSVTTSLRSILIAKGL